MTNTLNAPERKMMEAMRAAIVEKGADYVYDKTEATGVTNHYVSDVPLTCSYLNWRDKPADVEIPTAPSCIVGHAVLNSGFMDAERLETFEGDGAHSVLENLRLGDSYICGDVSNALAGIQMDQDNGIAWGKAWEDAMSDLEEYGYDVKEWRL